MNSIPNLGTLSRHPDIEEWLVTKPVVIPFLGGSPVQVIFTDLPNDDVLPPDVLEAVANFFALGVEAKTEATKPVYQNYERIMEMVRDDEDDEFEFTVNAPEEIWSYVEPFEVCVSRRHRRDKDIYIQLICNCSWEEEHGLQLVFRRGNKLVYVSDSNGHLTKAVAYDLPEEQNGA